ncbi:MAG: hypothetical protein GC131_01210 [Alphaproteobacteria bacterium]|nr:hypothetical protein [Alphaproteobacteria bacterium]
MNLSRIRSGAAHILSTPWMPAALVTALVVAFLISCMAGTTYLVSYRTAALCLVISSCCLAALLSLALMLRAKASASFAFNQAPTINISRTQIALYIMAMMFAVLLVRTHTYAEAYERDLMVYMSIADRLLDHWPLYSVLWDHKPPGVHWTYTSFAALFGPTPLALFLMGYAAYLATLFGCYTAGNALGGRFAGLMSAGVWSLTSSDLFLQGNQPNVEVFMNACTVWAVALILKGNKKISVPRYAIIGVLFFLASLYKTIAAVIPIVIFLTYLACLRSSARATAQPKQLITGALQTVLVGVIACSGWLYIFWYFYSLGDFVAFKEAVFDYNSTYAGNTFFNLLKSMAPAHHTIWALPYLPLFTTALAFLIAHKQASTQYNSKILLAYFAGTWLAFALPGKFFPHYYQLFLPPIAIVSGWMGASLLSTKNKAWIAMYFSLMLPMLFTQIYQITIPIEDIPVVKYEETGKEALETKRMAKWINENYRKDALVYHWGAEPGVYFWSQRKSPLGFVFNYPLLSDDKTGQHFSEIVLSELKAHKPDLIVANRGNLRNVDNTIEEWIVHEYAPSPASESYQYFVFMVPRKPH